MTVLVKFQADYADEFDVYGFKVFHDSEWEDTLKAIKENAEFPAELGFGSNEYITLETFEDYERCIDVTRIEDEQAAFLAEQFPNSDTYGWGQYLEPETVYGLEDEDWEEDLESDLDGD